MRGGGLPEFPRHAHHPSHAHPRPAPVPEAAPVRRHRGGEGGGPTHRVPQRVPAGGFGSPRVHVKSVPWAGGARWVPVSLVVPGGPVDPVVQVGRLVASFPMSPVVPGGCGGFRGPGGSWGPGGPGGSPGPGGRVVPGGLGGSRGPGWSQGPGGRVVPGAHGGPRASAARHTSRQRLQGCSGGRSPRRSSRRGEYWGSLAVLLTPGRGERAQQLRSPEVNCGAGRGCRDRQTKSAGRSWEEEVGATEGEGSVRMAAPDGMVTFPGEGGATLRRDKVAGPVGQLTLHETGLLCFHCIRDGRGGQSELHLLIMVKYTQYKIFHRNQV